MAAYVSERRLRSPAYQGYLLLRSGFILAPILFGLDKFFNFMVTWPKYLAPWVDELMPGTAQQFMYGGWRRRDPGGDPGRDQPPVGKPDSRRGSARSS